MPGVRRGVGYGRVFKQSPTTLDARSPCVIDRPSVRDFGEEAKFREEIGA